MRRQITQHSAAAVRSTPHTRSPSSTLRCSLLAQLDAILHATVQIELDVIPDNPGEYLKADEAGFKDLVKQKLNGMPQLEDEGMRMQ